jgi:DNA-directed RNA polymerase subunit RPC12/RpoP
MMTNTKNEEKIMLYECGFCGKPAKTDDIFTILGRVHWVVCESCGIRTVDCGSVNKAVSIWNEAMKRSK